MITVYTNDLSDSLTIVDNREIELRHIATYSIIDTSAIPCDVYFIDIAGESNKINKGLMYLSGNVIDMVRDNDWTMLAKLKKHRFNIPRTYGYNNITKLISHLDGTKKYLLKTVMQARTLGQLVVTKDELYEIARDSELLTNAEFQTKYITDPGDIFTDDEANILQRGLSSNSVILQEKVDFDEEYRVLIFKDKLRDSVIVEKRSGYQVGSKEPREHSVVDVSYIDRSFIDKLYCFVDAYGYPMMSFDVYVNIDKDGDKVYGIFEYCTTYGIVYPGYYDTLIKYTTNAILAAIDELK